LRIANDAFGINSAICSLTKNVTPSRQALLPSNQGDQVPEYYHVATELSNPATAPDEPTIKRLLVAARDLLADGLSPSEIESRVFRALTAPPGPDLPARRAQLFRVGIGLSQPLPRGEASDLADALGKALRGPRDAVFERRTLLAHLRGLLFQQAHDSAEGLRREGLEITSANLRAELMIAVVYAKPKSELVPWHLDSSIVERMIEVVVNDYFGGARCGAQ
jgi:hypothetical protein